VDGLGSSAEPVSIAGRQPGLADATGRRAMSGVVSEQARELAARLDRQFGRDADLAARLADAQQRLTRANDQLRRGVHPDGLATVYGEHPAVVNAAAVENRSAVLGARDPLAALQQVHWHVNRAFIDYQTAAEQRRQLAADTGEVIRGFIDALVATGWSEHDARHADVQQIAGSAAPPGDGLPKQPPQTQQPAHGTLPSTRSAGQHDLSATSRTSPRRNGPAIGR
jgi:hypothetical protein